MSLTPRKKLGLSILIGGALAVLVGAVVMATLTTPAWLTMIVTVVVMGAGTLLGIAITQPTIPE